MDVNKAQSLFSIFKFFSFDHLPPHLQKISKPFHDLALQMIENSPTDSWPETDMGLRKLLEAKDCFVRAGIKQEDPFQYDLQAFYKIIVANELGNDFALALKFSDADGVRTGKSGYSFGISQFDISNNQTAIDCLQECGFTPYEIQILKDQEASKEEMVKYENKLAANSHIIEKWDKVQIQGCLKQAAWICSSSGISIKNVETLYHLADYHNQFNLSRDGKLHVFMKQLESTITPEIILDFKLNKTAWGQKRPDDVRRRFDNIARICREK